LNGYNRTTPVEFRERLVREIPGQECFVMKPGDVLDSSTGEVVPSRTAAGWGHDLTEYIGNLTSHCREKYAGLRFDFGNRDDVHEEFLKYCRQRFSLPFPDVMKGEVIAIHVTGSDGAARSYFLDVGEGQVSCEEGSVPFLEITIPASLVGAFLSRRYDSFMILYSYRIAFQLNAPLGLTDEEECMLYITAVMAIFDYDLYLRELAGV
jgi:hypothetical protein